MAPDELGGDADAAAVGDVGRGDELDPLVQAATLVPPDGFGPAVPDVEADALATTPPCVCGGELQLTNVKPTRIAPTESRRTWNSPRTSALVISWFARTGKRANRYGGSVLPYDQLQRGVAPYRLRQVPTRGTGFNPEPVASRWRGETSARSSRAEVDQIAIGDQRVRNGIDPWLFT